jgi:hypothetical protein
MLKAQRKNDPAEAAGGDDPFAGYEGEVGGQLPAEQEQQVQAKATEQPADNTPAPDADPKPADPKAGDPPAGDPAPAGKGDEQPLGSLNPDEEFTLDDLEIKDAPIVTDDDSYNWMDIGKEIDIEVEEDSIDALKSGFTKKIETVRSQAVEEFLEKEKSYSPDAVRYIKMLNNGATELEIFEAEKPYRDFLVKSPEEKIIERAIINGFSKEYGQSEVDRLIENGTLEDEVKAIDGAIWKKLGDERVTMAQKYQQLAADKMAEATSKLKAENELISKAISERAEYRGVPLSKQVKDQIAARWNNGTYRKAFETNPNAVVDFIFNLELGKKVTEKRVSDTERKQQMNIQGKLNNLSTAQESARTSSQSAGRPAEHNPEDPWADFEGLPDNIGGVTYGKS